MLGDIRIGISGWRYTPWRGTFYPKKLAQRRELEYASRHVSSIEINGSFYSLQRPQNYRDWFEQTPDDFIFSLKGSRYLTHLLRLRNIETPLANFFGSGLLELKQKLGPILWQFPPNFKFNPEPLEAFFKLLPRDTMAAAELARRHDDKIKGRASVATDAKRPLRHAMEVRHESFRCDAFIKLLRQYKIALVVADTAGKWPYMEDVTSDFIYIRLHGDEEIYVSGYTPDAIDHWARRISLWQNGKEPRDAARVISKSAPKSGKRDVFVYFDNDVKVKAPEDAVSLAKKLGVWKPPVEDVLPTKKPARKKKPNNRKPAPSRRQRASVLMRA